MSFDEDVRPLFRETDQKSMSRFFDLWSHEDVSEHADVILERLEDGDMPCDAPWPEEKIAVFRRWVAGGKAE